MSEKLLKIAPPLILFIAALIAFHGQMMAPWYAWAGWLLALGFTLRILPSDSTIPALPDRAKWELPALGICILVGTLLRFYQITALPYGAWFDEAENTVVAREIWSNWSQLPTYISDKTQLPGLSFILFSPFTALFPDGVLGVRVFAALIGILTIPAVWLLTREISGKDAAIIAAAFMSINRWHLSFSRFGMTQILVPFLFPVALYFFIRALRRGSLRDGAFAGIAAGLAPQTYYPGILIFFAFAIYSALFFFNKKKQRSWLTVMLVTAIISVVTWAPTLQYAVFNFAKYSERVSNVSSGSLSSLFKAVAEPGSVPAEELEPIATSAKKHLLMFNIEGDANSRHNLAGEPMLNWIEGPLFLIGIAFAPITFYRPASGTLLALFTATLLGGILSLSFEAPQAGRTIGNVSLCCIFMGLACGAILALTPQKARSFFLLLFAVVLPISAGALNATTFFNEQLRRSDTWAGFSAKETKISELANNSPENATVYAPESLSGGPTIELLAKTRSKIKPADFAYLLPFPCDNTEKIVVLDENHLEDFELLLTKYPEAKQSKLVAPFDEGLLINIATIDPEALENTCGLESSRGSVKIISPKDPLLANLKSVSLKGVLIIPTQGLYSFVGSKGVLGKIKLAGKEFEIGDSLEGAAGVDLAKGPYEIQIQFTAPNAEWFLKWKTPSGEVEAIPSKLLLSPKNPIGGLLAEYYDLNGSTTLPLLSRIEPFVDHYFHLAPAGPPFRGVWSGDLIVAAEGNYTFELVFRDEVRLLIDNQVLFESKEPGTVQTKEIFLKAGRHPLLLTFSGLTGAYEMRLRWKRPGSEEFKTISESSLLPREPMITLP